MATKPRARGIVLEIKEGDPAGPFLNLHYETDHEKRFLIDAFSEFGTTLEHDSEKYFCLFVHKTFEFEEVKRFVEERLEEFRSNEE